MVLNFLVFGNSQWSRMVVSFDWPLVAVVTLLQPIECNQKIYKLKEKNPLILISLSLVFFLVSLFQA
jgi:hypothetical protein